MQGQLRWFNKNCNGLCIDMIICEDITNLKQILIFREDESVIRKQNLVI